MNACTPRIGMCAAVRSWGTDRQRWRKESIDVERRKDKEEKAKGQRSSGGYVFGSQTTSEYKSEDNVFPDSSADGVAGAIQLRAQHVG